MTNRIEVYCPVYDLRLQTELQTYLDLLLADNRQVLLLDHKLNMQPINTHQPSLKAQEAIYAWLANYERQGRVILPK